MRLFRFLLLPAVVSAFDYAMSGDSDDFGLRLTDVKTGITDILTIFTNEPTSVTVAGITWTEKENATVGSGDVVFWTTFVNNVIQAEGNFSLLDVGRELPTEIDAGVIEVSKRGSNNITVVLELDGATISAEHSYESYAPGVSIIPLILVLLLAASTRMVRLGQCVFRSCKHCTDFAAFSQLGGVLFILRSFRGGLHGGRRVEPGFQGHAQYLYPRGGRRPGSWLRVSVHHVPFWYGRHDGKVGRDDGFHPKSSSVRQDSSQWSICCFRDRMFHLF